MKPTSVEQMCRDLLNRAVTDHIIGHDPNDLTATELTGVANLQASYLRDAVAAERERILAALQAVADEYDRQAGRVKANDEIVRRAYVARDMIAAVLAGGTDAH